ncbi:unnamed protein product [Tilletia laevis]|nr:unnamed protein product [Tilletia caries]CAD6936267.1 unnamed protein product [Tilletia laevis]CAD6941801.1 unnamed protein product [Tilletia laevis]CAD7065046.1 unnamed protein product [Tilletia caries]
MGKEQSRIVDRSKPSPASIRLDVPVAVQATAHGSPSLLLSSSVAFGIGHVAASVTRRAPATIARTDSTGVSARSLAASCEQHASLAPAVQPHMAPVKPRPKALQWKSLSAKAKRDSIRSFHLRPARQDIAFGSLFPDYDPQSTTSKCGTHSNAPSKGPLGSNAGGTSSRVVRAARTKKAPDKLSLGLVQSTNTSLSSARISPSMSFTPLDPTGSGPPPLEGNRPTSPPDGSPNPSAWPYGGDHSTARGGRVSVDELGRRVVAKLHHTDIEQSRIIHLLDIGVLKLSSPEQTCTGGPAMQQQQAGVSPTSPKIGQDSQDVEVYATLGTCHSRGAASRVAASTAATRSAVSASPAAAANDAQRVFCPGIGLDSREVQPTESRRRPRAAAEAAEGVASMPQFPASVLSVTATAIPRTASSSSVPREQRTPHKPSVTAPLITATAMPRAAGSPSAQLSYCSGDRVMQFWKQGQAAGPDSARAGINSVRKDNGHLLCVPTRDSIVTTVRQLITRMQHDPGTDSSDADTDIPLRLWRSQR